MENYLADTKVLVDLIKQNKKEKVFINEFTLYEFMKNKDNDEKRKQFENLIEYIKKTDSVLLTTDTSVNIINLDKCGSFVYALTICKKDAEVLADMIINFLYIIITLNCLFKMHNYKKEEKIENGERIIAKTKAAFDMLAPSIKNDLPEILINNKSEEIENKVLTYFYNQFVRKINEITTDECFKLKNITSYSINEMIGDVSISIRKSFIKQYVENILDFNKNERTSKLFYKAYFEYLYCKKYKIEINDCVDMNIAFSAYQYHLSIKTTDLNFKNEYNDILTFI